MRRPELVHAIGVFWSVLATLIGYAGGGAGIGYLVWFYGGASKAVLLVFGTAGFALAIYRIYLIAEKEDK